MQNYYEFSLFPYLSESKPAQKEFLFGFKDHLPIESLLPQGLSRIGWGFSAVHEFKFQCHLKKKKKAFEETARKHVWPNICPLRPCQVDLKLTVKLPFCTIIHTRSMTPAPMSLKWVQCSLAFHVCKLCFLHFLIHSIATDGAAVPGWRLWWTVTFPLGTQPY